MIPARTLSASIALASMFPSELSNFWLSFF
jgi:hypothetical protein